MTMRKIASIFILLIIAATPLMSCFSAVSSADNLETQGSSKRWTWIFYNDADFNQAYDPMEDFADEAFSSENLDVIVLQDPNDGPAMLWYIDEDHNKILLEELGEVNMGNYTTLRYLIDYGKQNFPSDRYLLSAYNHGMGWFGACGDDTDKDFLTMDEFQRALEKTGGVDIICFTAPCSMGAVESAYELRNCADVYIGSEAGSGFCYWKRIIDDMCDLLNEKFSLSNVQIGEKIIQLIDGNVHSSEFRTEYGIILLQIGITISAIDSGAMNNVSKYIDKLAKDLVCKINEKRLYRFRIKIIHYFTQSFGFQKIEFARNTLDLYDFAKKCSIFFAFDSTINLNAKNLMKSIDEAVIANIHGIRYPRAYGLTIYFPFLKELYSSGLPFYIDSDFGLDFTNDTHWDEFLELYLS